MQRLADALIERIGNIENAVFLRAERADGISGEIQAVQTAHILRVFALHSDDGLALDEREEVLIFARFDRVVLSSREIQTVDVRIDAFVDIGRDDGVASGLFAAFDVPLEHIFAFQFHKNNSFS